MLCEVGRVIEAMVARIEAGDRGGCEAEVTRGQRLPRRRPQQAAGSGDFESFGGGIEQVDATKVDGDVAFELSEGDVEDAVEILALRHAASDLVEEIGPIDLRLQFGGALGDAAFEFFAGLIEMEFAFLNAFEHDIETADELSQFVLGFFPDPQRVILFLPDPLSGVSELQDGAAEHFTESG